MEDKFYVIRKEDDEKLVVRKMTDEEIDNNDCQHYCDEQTSIIYEDSEIVIIESLSKLKIS